MPAAASTSALPLELETLRLPCLATGTPSAASSSALAVDTLNSPAPSPPVPQVSTRRSRSAGSTCSGRDFSRITCAAAAISSGASPFMRSAIRNPATWAGVASPPMISRITSSISARGRVWPASSASRA